MALFFFEFIVSDSLGDLLRAAREAQGKTLDELEQTTRIRAKYLEALETDQFGALPSDTHTRGFLRNYAEALGLDAPAVIDRYDEARKRPSLLALATPKAEAAPLPIKPKAEKPPPTARSSASLARPRRLHLLSPDVWVAVLITLGLLTLLGTGGWLIWLGALVPLPSSTATSTLAPVGVSIVNITRTATPTKTSIAPLADEASPTVELPPTLEVYEGVILVVFAEQRTWVQVVVDGKEAFAGQFAPGESQTFVGRKVIDVVASNGKGTRVIWNGQDQGRLGELGEVVSRKWTDSGMIIPTPTETREPTNTPIPSNTPVPSRTPRP